MKNDTGTLYGVAADYPAIYVGLRMFFVSHLMQVTASVMIDALSECKGKTSFRALCSYILAAYKSMHASVLTGITNRYPDLFALPASSCASTDATALRKRP